MYTVRKYRFDIVRELDPFPYRVKISSKKDVKMFVNTYLKDIPIENVVIIALDSGNRIIGFQSVQGTTNQCALYPSNVFRFLMICGASSFLIAHNHPGGTASPSGQDWAVTYKLLKAGKLLEIPLQDHLIIADESAISMREFREWDDR